MKRLLLPLLAAIALPTAFNAETWYLLGSAPEELGLFQCQIRNNVKVKEKGF